MASSHTLAVTLSALSAVSLLQVSAESVCYGNLGCFNTAGQLLNLPLAPEHMQTTWTLHTRNFSSLAVLKAVDSPDRWQQALLNSSFDVTKETKVITHGYTDSSSSPWVGEMVTELLKHYDYNVWVTDWTHGSHATYGQAVANSLLVARQLASFLLTLHQHHGLDLARVHLIGHSLGAQASGNAGAMLPGLGRISALDPAEPYFKTDLTDSDRLDKSDATFVDVIHTDGEDFSVLQGYGLKDPVGHVDFYPNGGVDQPGCGDSVLSGLLGVLQGNHGDQNIACSHSRSHRYFTESINARGCRFYAHPCSSWADYESGRCLACPAGGCPVMGFHQDSSVQGIYYLSTAQSPPFCGREYFVEAVLSSNRTNAYGRLFLTILGSERDSDEIEFTRENRHYHENDRENHVIAIHTVVGQVTGVKVRFTKGDGLPSLGTQREIVVTRIVLQDLVSGQRTIVCTRDVQLMSDQPFVFNASAVC